MFSIKRWVFAAVLISIPGLAVAWRAWNRLEVYPVSKTVFEVIGEPGSGAADYWCGAGDFAISVLRSKVADRVYIWRAIGGSVNKPGYKAVQFSLKPPADTSPSPGYSLSVKATGDNLTAAAARQYCFGQMDKRCTRLGC